MKQEQSDIGGGIDIDGEIERRIKQTISRTGATRIGSFGSFLGIEDALGNAGGSEPMILELGEHYDPANDPDEIEISGEIEEGDNYPTFSPLIIRGCGPEQTHIDTHISISGGAHSQYKRPIVMEDFTTTKGISVDSAPYGIVRNVVASTDNGKDGFLIDGPKYDSPPFEYHSFGWKFITSMAYGCDGDGFRTAGSAGAHETNFFGCDSIANQGVGYRLRGYATSFFGGSSQLNHSYGFDLRNGKGMSLNGMYIEGNDRGADGAAADEPPLELYAKDTSITAMGNYWAGLTPRSTEHEQKHLDRGLNVHNSDIALLGNQYRFYNHGLLNAFNGSTAEIMRPTNLDLDGSDLVGKTSDSEITNFGHVE